MASKTLSIYDQDPGSQPRRTAAAELQVSAGAQPSEMAFLPPDIPSFCGGSRLRYLRTDPLGSENFRVALAPPAKSAPRFRVGASDTAPLILLLPLTWKELMERAGAEADHSRSLHHSVVRFGAVRVTRTFDNCVLRKKLEPDPAYPVHFQTVYGVGYRFVFEASRALVERRIL